MDVTQIGCSTTGGSSRTFFISSCGGFRMANNPATSTVTALFDENTNPESLPDVLRLSSEKSGTVKEVKVKGQFSEQAAKTGIRVDIDVQTLPGGTYYLQGIYGSERVESIRVILQ